MRDVEEGTIFDEDLEGSIQVERFWMVVVWYGEDCSAAIRLIK